MQVDRKYYCNNTIHRTLLPAADDPENATLSCGFLHKQGSACVQKDLCFRYYGGLYVISGHGIYIDAVTGKEYPVGPGWVLQRMPGVPHHTIIDKNSDWLEFYFCGGAAIFEALASMNMATRKPVFFIGEKDEIFSRLLAYFETFRTTDDIRAEELLMEFQFLLRYMNGLMLSAPSPQPTDRLTAVLKRNCNVGVPIRKIAEECGIGYETLRKEFPKRFGCSIEKYCIRLRINAAKKMLLDQKLPIKTVAAELGYCDVYAFSKQFKQYEGIPPKQFVRNWNNMRSSL
ncbi:MAG: helix-turn-helix transcriptional regulator [Clostridia bacterium]|nr:helix-turn-helix transcriptional regulator [Clostridia bacterium]